MPLPWPSCETVVLIKWDTPKHFVNYKILWEYKQAIFTPKRQVPNPLDISLRIRIKWPVKRADCQEKTPT